MERFTSEDIKALREYLDKLEELSKTPPPVALTQEEWNEAMNGIQAEGKIPAKYAGRIGESEIISYTEIVDGKMTFIPEGVKRTGYYDIAAEAYNKRFVALREKYIESLDKVFATVFQNKERISVNSIESIIREILDSPEAMRELEKAAAAKLEISRIAPVDSLPNGEIINLLLRIINGSKGGRIIGSTSRNEEITVKEFRGNRQFIRKNKKKGSTEIITIEQADNLLNRSGKTFSKVFLFTLMKMTAQGFPLEVGFNLQEMVDMKMYSRIDNAGRAVKDFFEQQKLTTLGGSIKKGKETIKEEGGVLFYHYRINNGFVTLSVNERFNIEFIAPYFTVFPRFAFGLSDSAFHITRYIFFLARQNAKPIKENGTFFIGLDVIREYLGLPAPDEVKNRKYRQYIIDPIEKAIEEIEEAIRNEPEAQDYGFTITMKGTETTKISEWLQGSLEVGLRGDYADRFVKLATKAENRMKKYEQARLTAKAQADEKASRKKEAHH